MNDEHCVEKRQLRDMKKTKHFVKSMHFGIADVTWLRLKETTYSMTKTAMNMHYLVGHTKECHYICVQKCRLLMKTFHQADEGPIWTT